MRSSGFDKDFPDPLSVRLGRLAGLRSDELRRFLVEINPDVGEHVAERLRIAPAHVVLDKSTRMDPPSTEKNDPHSRSLSTIRDLYLALNSSMVQFVVTSNGLRSP